mgnify:CR=1 FL=1
MSYEWLKKEAAPRHLVAAVSLMGTKEVPGQKNNPVIMGWAKELGMEKIYTNDDTAWCGLFVAYIVFKAGREPLRSYAALRASNWANWGVNAMEAMLGDILVFVRPGGGHVGLYVGEDATAYHVLGGNQSNTVNVVRIAKARCTAIRRPAYNNPPENIRTIVLAATGTLSLNEA